MAAVRRTKLIELGWRAHRRIFRATGGRLFAKFGGMPIAMLTAIGRTSGRPRGVTIPFLRDEDRYVSIASNAGEARDPDWVLNLRANPLATLKIRGREIAVTAREAEGGERARLWARAVATNPDYAEYERRVSARRIPVMVFEPR